VVVAMAVLSAQVAAAPVQLSPRLLVAAPEGGRFQQAPGAPEAVRLPPHLLVAAAVGGR
jgi:hypothetical protein